MVEMIEIGLDGVGEIVHLVIAKINVACYDTTDYRCDDDQSGYLHESLLLPNR